MQNVTEQRGLRFLITVAGVIVLIAGLREGQSLLVPLVISALLAALTAPLVLWLDRHRVPPALSVPLVVLVVLGLMLGFVGLLVGTGKAFVAAFPRYQQSLNATFGGAADWLQGQGIDLNWQLLKSAIEPESAVRVLDTTLSGLTNAVSYTMLVIFTMVFMLFEVTGLPMKLRAAIGDPDADLSHFEKVTTEIKNYIVIKTYISLGTGLMVWLLLAILDVDFALLWGVFAFLFNFIPTIGSIIAAVPAVLLALVQHGFGVCAIVLGGYVAINLIVGNVVEPHLMGRRLGLSTLVVFLSLVFWGWVWGVAGMLLSVPLTMIVKIALENDEHWRWLAVLMDQAPKHKNARFSIPPPSSPVREVEAKANRKMEPAPADMPGEEGPGDAGERVDESERESPVPGDPADGAESSGEDVV